MPCPRCGDTGILSAWKIDKPTATFGFMCDCKVAVILDYKLPSWDKSLEDRYCLITTENWLADRRAQQGAINDERKANEMKRHGERNAASNRFKREK